MQIIRTHLFYSLLMLLTPCQASFAQEQKLEAGKTLSLKAAGETGITYHVYAPENYDANAEPRPILVAFSPGGRGLDILNKLKPGAEKQGWIVVGCDKLRNQLQDRELVLKMEDEVLDDIFKNIPHASERIYLGGFSGGGMRAYDLTTRRKKPFAGIIAYGGWLGGPSYQNAPYREGLSIAMINGINDQAANGWMPVDTASLRKRNCTVKHYTFLGGHGIAPAEITGKAIDWLENDWKRKTASNESKKIPLHVLYVGEKGKRADDFKSFLSPYFSKVTVIEPDQCTLEVANDADVLLLDATVRSLPEGYTKAMVLIGSSAAMTAERYGSKIDWFCQCLDNEAYAVNTSHPIFQSPFSVKPTLVEKHCPHAKFKIQAWKVEEKQKTPGLVSSRRYFEGSSDSEIISGGVNMKGIHGVPLVREAHRLLWGFIAPPSEMTEEGRKVFVNALTWIHQYDGHQQRVFRGIHARHSIVSILDCPYIDETNLKRWFPEDLLKKTNHDKAKLREHFKGKLQYVYVPMGGGQLRIDADAEKLQTPNNNPESLKKWASMLDGEKEQVALAKKLLYRYTGMRIRNPKKWKAWVKANADSVEFSDDEGYRFAPRNKDVRRTINKYNKQHGLKKSMKLTELAPVQF